jgi:hypothetical protein
MGEDTPAVNCAGRVRSSAENDVVAHGIGCSSDRRGRSSRPFTGVDADIRKVST